MSAPGDRHAARWVTPGAVVLAAALTGFGARSLWPKSAPQATAQAAVPVYTAQVVRTDVRQRQVVAGTIGYGGSFTITFATTTPPQAASASAITQGQQAIAEDQQVLSGDQRAESDAAATGRQAIAADQANVSAGQAALASDQARQSYDCTYTADTSACTSDAAQVRTDQTTLTQARQALAAAQVAARSSDDQAQAKVGTDQAKVAGDQAALASLQGTGTSAPPGATYTWLPAAGQVITQDQPVYAVSGQPVPLLYGAVPAYRAFSDGMPDGADVGELTRDLIALGYGAGLTQSDHYSAATAVAVQRWRKARGLPPAGQISLGEVVFEPGPIRVTATPASAGAPAAPGSQVLTATSVTPSVTVNLTPGSTPARPGDPVRVTLPDNTTVSGHVRTVGAVTQAPASQNQGTPAAIIPVTISLDGYRLPTDLDQAPVQVIMTEQIDPNVLAVPVTALLAQPGGGYAVRTAARQTVPVNIGIYDDTTGLVEVSGAGLAAGMTVQVAEG